MKRCALPCSDHISRTGHLEETLSYVTYIQTCHTKLSNDQYSRAQFNRHYKACASRTVALESQCDIEKERREYN
jgi:hypothetical protein